MKMYGIRRCSRRRSPTSSLIVVSVWMSSTSGSASSASMTCAAPANRSGPLGPGDPVVAGGRDRVQADDDHALGAERQRGLDRRVQARAAVEVPARGRAVVDLDRRERGRDRGGGAHVLLVEHRSGRSRCRACRRGSRPACRRCGRRRCGRCSADVATTAAAMQPARVDVLADRARTGSAARACCSSGVASSSAGTSSDSRPVKFSAAAGDPLEVAQRRRGEHVAPPDLLPDRAAGGSAGRRRRAASRRGRRR